MTAKKLLKDVCISVLLIKARNLKVVVIGDVAIDFTVLQRHADECKYLESLPHTTAGVGGNVCWYLRQLGCEVTLISAVGSDDWGKEVLKDLLSAGIEAKCKVERRSTTGFFIVLVNREGERWMIGSRGANKTLNPKLQEILDLKPDWLHLSGYMLLNDHYQQIFDSVKEAAGIAKIPLSIDLEGVAISQRRLDLSGLTVTSNLNEFKSYYVNSKIRPGSERMLVVKAGSEGSFLYLQGKRYHIRSLHFRAKDTTAAGDAFNAGLIWAMLNGEGPFHACMWANAVAGYKVKRLGARAELNMQDLKILFEKVRKVNGHLPST